MFKKIKTSMKTFKENRKRKKLSKEHGNGDGADETSTYRNYSDTQSVLHNPSSHQSVYLRQTRSTGDLLKVPSISPTSLEAQSQLSLQPQDHKNRNSWTMLNNNNKKAEKRILEEQKQLEKQRVEWLKKLEKQRIENERRMEKLLKQERVNQQKIEDEKEKIQQKIQDKHKVEELKKIEIPAPKEPLFDALAIESIRHHDYAALDQTSRAQLNMFFSQLFTLLFFLFAMIVVFITFLRFIYVLGITIYKFKIIW